MNQNLSEANGFWPVLMSEARSALPDAPTVDDLSPVRLPRSRTVLAVRLHQLADAVAPRRAPQPVSSR